MSNREMMGTRGIFFSHACNLVGVGGKIKVK